MLDQPRLPDYGGPCIANLVPALLDPAPDPPAWLSPDVLDAEQVVLLVLDGLGWEQWQARLASTPALAALDARAITTVAPTTTATALTSITTGLTPGEHGLVGYRLCVDRRDRKVLNVLRWSVAGRDAREAQPPARLQPATAFAGQRPAIVTRAEFRDSGFTAAHLAGARFAGYRVVSTLVTEIALALSRNEPFVYAYYDGVDKVSHEYGLNEFFDAEVVAADRLVADVLAVLPPGAALLVTADHGQVEVGDRVVRLHPDVLAQTELQSGEGRFRWLHARAGRVEALLEAASAQHADDAWVVTAEQAIADGWFGPKVTDAARDRLGDVALVARTDVAFHDQDDSGPYDLVGRHGSLTDAEMLVPLCTYVAT